MDKNRNNAIVERTATHKKHIQTTVVRIRSEIFVCFSQKENGVSFNKNRLFYRGRDNKQIPFYITASRQSNETNKANTQKTTQKNKQKNKENTRTTKPKCRTAPPLWPTGRTLISFHFCSCIRTQLCVGPLFFCRQIHLETPPKPAACTVRLQQSISAWVHCFPHCRVLEKGFRGWSKAS